MPTATDAVDLCVGEMGTGCILSVDGAVTCWGADYLDHDPDAYAAVSGGTFSQISCGSYHACGVTTDGAAMCWGGNNEGQSDVPP